jgi:hypothetical protein
VIPPAWVCKTYRGGTEKFQGSFWKEVDLPLHLSATVCNCKMYLTFASSELRRNLPIRSIDVLVIFSFLFHRLVCSDKDFIPPTISEETEKVFITRLFRESGGGNTESNEFKNYFDGVPLDSSKKYAQYVNQRLNKLPQPKKPSAELLYTMEMPQRHLNFTLEIVPNQRFIAPNFRIEHRVGSVYLDSFTDDSIRKCFYHGSLREQDGSQVIVSVCNGLEGVIRASFGTFKISPLTNNNLDGNDSIQFENHSMERRVHLLSKLEDKNKAKKENHDEACSVSKGFGAYNYKSSHLPHVVHGYTLKYGNNHTIQAVKSKKRRRRSYVQRRYIETMVVADQDMYEFYGRKEVDIRKYLLQVMAVVTSIMKDSTIGNFLEIAVVKLIILRRNPYNLRVKGDASSILKSFCKWQKRINRHSDRDPEHYDTAILVTRTDLCATHRKCETLGLAELKSICDPIRSCAVVEDNGLSVGFTIAHELGHL